MPKSEHRVVEIDGTEIAVELERVAGHAARELRGGIDAETLSLRVLSAGPSARVLVDDRVVAITLPSARVESSVVRAGVLHQVRVATQASAAGARGAAAASSGKVMAPMPGRVVAVRVEVGAEVERGAALVVIEAMKMQNELFAPSAGVVKSVRVQPGDAVERGAVLIELG